MNHDPRPEGDEKDEEMRIERLLPGPIEKVWEHLTDPVLVMGWLGNDVTLDANVDGEVTLALEDGQIVKGTVTRCDPPRVIAYTWDDGQLSFELVPRGQDVVLIVTQRRRGKDVRSHSRSQSLFQSYAQRMAA